MNKEVYYRSFWTDNEYRTVIARIKERCPEMVRSKHKIQWRYKKPSNRISIPVLSKFKSKFNLMNKDNYISLINELEENLPENSDMSCIVAFDKFTNEPVAFCGINFLKHSKIGVSSRTICVYVDPDYRRQGISEAMHIIHEEKCRILDILFTDEVQIGNSLFLSEKLGYEKITNGRLCNDGTYSQVKFRIHNNSKESLDRFRNLNQNKDISKWYIKGNLNIDKETIENYLSQWKD